MEMIEYSSYYVRTIMNLALTVPKLMIYFIILMDLTRFCQVLCG